MKLYALLILTLLFSSCAIAQSASSNSVPGELVGKWYNGSTSSLEYLDRGTGIANAAGGNGTGLEIKADGSFTKAQLAKVGLYGCSTVVFGYQTGILKAAGDTLTFDIKKFYVSYKDSCNPHTNSEKNAAPSRHEWQYELKTDEDARETLCLNDGNEEQCYWREQDA